MQVREVLKILAHHEQMDRFFVDDLETVYLFAGLGIAHLDFETQPFIRRNMRRVEAEFCGIGDRLGDFCFKSHAAARALAGRLGTHFEVHGTGEFDGRGLRFGRWGRDLGAYQQTGKQSTGEDNYDTGGSWGHTAVVE